jgi:hypothetical protein
MKPKDERVLPVDLEEAIANLVDYNWEDEERDFQENPDPRHIFVDIKKIHEWLQARWK